MSSAERSKAQLSKALQPESRATRTWSLAARLATWYVVSAFALVLVVSGGLYWALLAGMRSADDEILIDKVHVLRSLLSAPHPDRAIIEQEIGEDANAPRRIYLRVLALDGTVLYQSPHMATDLPPAVFPRTPNGNGEAAGGRTVQGSDRTSYRALSNRLRYISVGKPHEVIVQAAIDTTSDEVLLARYRTALGIILGVALILCAAAGYQIVRVGLLPVHRIARAAEEIEASTLDKRLAVEGLPPELRGLATTFNAMLERLEDSFGKLRQFSDDIAHELRTPVNRLLIANEVALRQTRSVDDYHEVLSSNIDACTRLSQTVQSLLFLARSENPQSRLQRENVEIAPQLSAIQEFYEPLANEKGIDLSTECSPGLTAAGDRSLLQRAVGNLVANAIAHTPQGGSIKIVGRDLGASLSIEVADTGEGIAAEHLPYVFDRFFRVERDRPSSDGNLGLGLAIVKSVAALHDGSVSIDSEAGRGTLVAIRLPKTSDAHAD